MAAPIREGEIVSQIDHIGIAVRDLDRSLEAFERLFGVKPKHAEVVDALHLRAAFVPIGEVMIELLQPTAPGKGRIGEFIDRHGEGFHHIAYRVVGDLAGVLTDLKAAGISLRDEEPRPGSRGSRILFVSPEETSNVLTELVEIQQEA